MGTLFPLHLFRPASRNSRRRAQMPGLRSVEALESRVMLSAAAEPFEQRFDFGTSSSPVAAGNVRLTPAMRYSAAVGHGWALGTIQDRDRGATYGDERSRDFNFSPNATFAVDVPAGVYEVTVALGDGISLRDEMGIFLEGTHLDTVTATAGQYETRTFTVTVADGQLTLTLQDLGGANNLVMINSLDVVQVAGDLSGPQVAAATSGGEVFDTLQQFTVTFDEEIDADTFTIDDVTLSGPDGLVSPTAITQVDAVTFQILFDTQTAFGEYTLQVGPEIADLDGHLMNQDGDDVNGEAGEDVFSHTLTLSPTPELLQTYDFGTTSSPVGSGATQVSNGTVYSAESGFGWTEGTIDSRDRGSSAGDDLSRDFNLTTAGTFVVDVLAEEAVYDVTIVMGDLLAARDEMGLLLEGTQFDSVSTAAGAYETRTFRVTVSDGQLTLRLEDLGGADPIAVINSLQVRHVETLNPPDDGGEEGGDDGDGDAGEGDGESGDGGDSEGGGAGDGDDHGDGEPGDEDHEHERPGKGRGWKFIQVIRKGKAKWLPSVASSVAFDPPGHGGEVPGKHDVLASISQLVGKARGRR
jgi:fibronectin type 3 domain-containing protein